MTPDDITLEWRWTQAVPAAGRRVDDRFAAMDAVIRVVILDDHALFHQALMAWLQSQGPSIEVAYAGADVDRALDAAPGSDVVLLDLDLGAEAPPLPQLVAGFQDAGCRVLIVSALGSPRVVRQGLAAGALGYMSKREDPAELLDGDPRRWPRARGSSPPRWRRSWPSPPRTCPT